MPRTFLNPPSTRELANAFADMLALEVGPKLDAERRYKESIGYPLPSWHLVKTRKDGSVTQEVIPLHRVYRDPWDTRDPKYNDRSRDTPGMRWISIDEALGNTPGNLKLSVLAVRWAWRI